MTQRVALLLLALGLAACGGGEGEQGPPPDLRLDQANKAGTVALANNNPTEAVRQYRQALSRAYERDDAEAIGDTGYNLAVAQLREGAVQDAARTVRETRAELERRKLQPPAELVLVQAAIAYRLGARDEALAAADEVLARPALAPETASRAWYMHGAVLADRGDAAGLARTIAALPPSSQPDPEADRLELTGRAAMLSGATAQAIPVFEQAADQRRLALDYRGMARALSFAADATLRSGRTADAAVLYLRAGRSAQLQGDVAGSRTLLDKAGELARQAGASDVLGEIDRVKREAAASAAVKAGSAVR